MDARDDRKNIETYRPDIYFLNGQTQRGFCNPNEINPVFLDRISTNLKSYVQNKGIPKIYKGNPVSWVYGFGISKRVIPGETEFNNLLKYFNLDKRIIDLSEYFQKPKITQYSGIKKRLFDFLKNIDDWFLKNDYERSLNGLVYCLAVQETPDVDFNVNIQPSLRNVLGIDAYFKLKKSDQFQNIDLDKKLIEIMEEIPSNLRRKQFTYKFKYN